MEQRKTQVADNRASRFSFGEYRTAGDSDVNQRLNQLLKLNAETVRADANFKAEFEQFEVSLMKNPMSAEQTFGYFGLMLGLIPQLTTLFTITSRTNGDIDLSGLLILGFFMTAITAIVGYFMGKRVGITISNLV